MSRIFFATWHGSYQMIKRASSFIDSRIDLSIFSGKELEDGWTSLEECLDKIEEADLVVYYVTQSFSMWGDILEKAKSCNKKILYVGTDATEYIKDYEDIEKTAKCNLYTTYGGIENYGQMVNYLASLLDDEISFKEPCEMPWEGIYHPDFSQMITSSEAYFEKCPPSPKGIIGLLFSRSNWVNDDLAIENTLIRMIEENGYSVLPVFTAIKEDLDLGCKGAASAVNEFFFDKQGMPYIHVMIKMQGSFLMDRSIVDENNIPESVNLLKRLNCPVVHPVTTSTMSKDEWLNDPFGTLSDMGWSIALPEMEGVIEPILIGATHKTSDLDNMEAIEERCKKLISRVIQWANLAQKENKDKKVVFVLNSFPCASVEAGVGGGANLDTFESIVHILKNMKEAGYELEEVPESGKILSDTLMSRKAISEFRWTTVKEIINKGGALDYVSKEQYQQWFNELPECARKRMTESWGNPPGEEIDDIPPAMIYEDKIVISGLNYKNALVSVQPKRGCAGARCDGTVCKILHDPNVPPTHQYVATYKYYEKKYEADILIHVGTHGNLEFLPGRGTGLTDGCYPDIVVGNMPFLYIYNSDNPPEGIIAKRRGLGTLVDHMQTVLTTSGLYDNLEELNTLLEKYEKLKTSDKTQAHLLEHLIKEEIEKCNLDKQINLDNYHDEFNRITEQAHQLLTVIRNTQIQDGQHIFGKLPQGKERLEFINSIIRYEGLETTSLRSALCKLFGLDFQYLLANSAEISTKYLKSNGAIISDLDTINKNIISVFLAGMDIDVTMDIFLDYELGDLSQINIINMQKERVLDINKRIDQSKEIHSLMEAMDSKFVEPGPAGVITRGRNDVLP
uniref:cobaltochelatase subunit CobN n=1 Tax=Alkalibaculum bacchi TaxID=645887 RepID=UPI0026EF1074